MKSSKRLIIWGAAILVIGAFSAHADEPEGSPDFSGEEYCLRSIGDFDHDGINDYAASKKNPLQRMPLTAYILPGAKIHPDNLNFAELTTNQEVIVLRGPKAAPFMCMPGPITPRIPNSYRTSASAPAAAKLKAASPIGRPTYYEFINMNEMSPAGYTIPEAINSAGHVAGTFWVANREDRAFLYDGASVYDLGTLGGDFSQALDLNNFDDVVGFSGTGEVDEYGYVMNACVHDGFPMESLGPGDSWANGINDKGQVVGGFRDAGKAVRAFFYNAGRSLDIGTLGGRSSEAHAINLKGAIVGTSRVLTDKGPQWHHAFVYRKGVMRDLGTLGRICWISNNEGDESCFEESIATDINARGRIVGFSSTDESSAHAFLFMNGVMRDLGTLGGVQSWANGINNSGQIVGTSLNSDEDYTPFIYDQGVMYDLNGLIADPIELPFLPAVAEDINDFGQIVGAYYMLNPIYESIPPGSVYAFSETLGSRFNLEYWVAPSGSPPGGSKKERVRLQVKIEVPGNQSRRFLNRWIPFGLGLAKNKWGMNWQRASIFMPKPFQGKNAKISIRVVSSAEQPVVYMRRFKFS